MNDDAILTVIDACRVLKISRDTLMSELSRGKFSGTYSYLGKRLRFNRRRLEDSIGGDSFDQEAETVDTEPQESQGA